MNIFNKQWIWQVKIYLFLSLSVSHPKSPWWCLYLHFLFTSYCLSTLPLEFLIEICWLVSIQNEGHIFYFLLKDSSSKLRKISQIYALGCLLEHMLASYSISRILDYIVLLLKLLELSLLSLWLQDMHELLEQACNLTLKKTHQNWCVI